MAVQHKLTVKQVCEILNVSKSWVHLQANSGRIRASRGPSGHHEWLFEPKDVETLRSAPDAQQRTKLEANRTKLWGRLTLAEAPAREDIMTVQEAAQILGTCVDMVHHYIRIGRLYAYQSRPGRQSCRKYLSRFMVNSLALQPDRIKRQNAIRSHRENGLSVTSGWPEMNVGSEGLSGPNNNGRLHHGEFYSLRQAAMVANVHPTTIRKWHRTGKLQGYRYKTATKRVAVPNPSIPLDKLSFSDQCLLRAIKQRSWWFFRKVDVQAIVRRRAW